MIAIDAYQAKTAARPVEHTQFYADWPFRGFMSSAVDACDQTKTRFPFYHEDRRKLEGIMRKHMREVRRTTEQYAAAIQYAHQTSDK